MTSAKSINRFSLEALGLLLLTAGCVGDDGRDGGVADDGAADTTGGGVASDEPSTGGPQGLPPAIPLTDDASPEDVIVYDGVLYTSNFANGSVLRVDLGDLDDVRVFVPPAGAGDPLDSGWGLSVLEREGWLLTVAGAPLNLMGPPVADGEVRAYALADGSLQATWTMPAGFQGNSIDVAADGTIYLGDFGAPRILTIDPATDAVEVWKEDAVAWPPGGFGLGGMILDQGGDAVYVSGGAGLWRVPINGDGTAGDTEPVILVDETGADFMWAGADGMSQSEDGSIYFAINDALTEGAVGQAMRIVLDTPTSGTISVIAEGLADPSGVFAARHDGQDYLFVNESQFGVLFGVDPGQPNLPYRVLVFPQP